MIRRALVLAAALALGGCATVPQALAPAAGDEQTLVCTVVDAPATTTEPDPTTTPPAPAPAPVEVYGSGNLSELTSSLPVATSSGAATRMVVFSVPIGDLPLGAALSVAAEYEATNPLGYNVMVASYLILADSPTATTGVEIAEANGFNITANMHHGIITKVGALVVTEATPAAYVNLVSYAASSAATPGATLRVEQDYGRLSVLVWR